MFIIGEATKYTPDYAVRNREIVVYCKSEGVSLMDITKSFEKKSVIEFIKKMIK